MTLIEWLQYILLGLVQGISEILPISSSGHLALFQHIFQLSNQNFLSFTLFLHLGSLIALVVYFFPLLWKIVQSLFIVINHGFQLNRVPKQDTDRVLLIFWIGIATLPAALAGLLLKSFLETIFSELWMIGIGFLWTATSILFLSRLTDQQNKKIGWKSSMVAGFFQVLGVFPGVSRSGMTILGSKLAGLSLSDAKQFSFLMFLPITLGAFIVDWVTLDSSLNFQIDTLGATVVASLISGIATWGALHLFLNHLTTRHFVYFSWYLFLLGTLTILGTTLF